MKDDEFGGFEKIEHDHFPPASMRQSFVDESSAVQSRNGTESTILDSVGRIWEEEMELLGAPTLSSICGPRQVVRICNNSSVEHPQRIA